MIKKIWEGIKKYGKAIIAIIIAIFTALFGIFVYNKISKDREKKQINQNTEDINKIKEDKKEDEKTANNIDNNFNNSPFNKSRRKVNNRQ